MPLSVNPGVLAGRYRMDSLIAFGGMGEVWRAVDLVLDRPVAVKILQPEYAQHPETLDRFRAEARHAAGLSHPAIAQVYDFGEGRDGQPPFLVMELVDGSPLTSLLASGPLEPGRTLDVVAQVAAGLAVAHAAGVMHRDIKPGNLLVDASGDIKITDFGIAHAAGSAPLTRTGMVMGTPAYLAPERVGGAAAGPASDLYSLGMVAYHCLTGQLPFTGTALEIALAQRNQPLPPLPDTVPAPVTSLVDSLTARDPAMRPASAAQVAGQAAALRMGLSGEDASATGQAVRAARATPWPGSDGTPVQAGPGAADATRILTGRQAIWAAGDVPGASAGIEPAGPGYADRRPPDQVRPRPGGPGSRRRAVLAIAAAIILAACLGGWVLASSAGSWRPGQAASPPSRSPSHPASHAPARTVLVRAAALIGQPVRVVASELRSRGLTITVGWAPAHGRPPGTVLAVTPTGRLRPRTTVHLTAARRPRPGKKHGKQGGPGHGKGHVKGHGKGRKQDRNGQGAG